MDQYPHEPEWGGEFALTWMAGTRVKYPIRMIPSSVAMFFIIDQLSLLKPGEKKHAKMG